MVHGGSWLFMVVHGGLWWFLVDHVNADGCDQPLIDGSWWFIVDNDQLWLLVGNAYICQER